MKALTKLALFALLLVMGFGAVASERYYQERLNMPGDNLNLYAVMKLFQESETLEAFERELNNEENKINNLDLNYNNLIDYIKVIDYVDGDAHTIVLQVAISKYENQDVAVFTVNKDRYGNVQVQLIGDEDLYGKNYIIEPYYEDDVAYNSTPNPGYVGNTRVVNGETVVITRTTYVEVRTWPVVRYIYTPTYVVWRSPWYWDYYPTYWRPWRPYYWDYYYGYHYNWHHHYYGHFRHCNHYRYAHFNDHYYHRHRVYSTTVRTYRDNGKYNYTYSRPELRREGSAEYVRRHGNSSTGRTANNSAVGRTGRASSEVRNDAGRRYTNPSGVQRSSGSATGRSSSASGRTEERADIKRQPERPAVAPRNTQPSGFSRPAVTSERKAERNDAGSVRQGREVTGRTAQPSGRTVNPSNSNRGTSAREISRQTERNSPRTPAPEVRSSERRGQTEVKQVTNRPTVNPRTSAPEVRSTERRGQPEVKQVANRPTVSPRTSAPEVRSSERQNTSRQANSARVAPSASSSRETKAAASKPAVTSERRSSGESRGTGRN